MMTRSVSKTAGKRRPAPERFESEKALAELALMSKKKKKKTGTLRFCRKVGMMAFR
jgi:hypothetical protein